ncbi:MAG TPA: ABC transporter ATP-binding protein [Caldilineae bacterium]|nr:ABC transporter ATP-binding protein [Caldilineae bacterium]
MIEVQKLDAGYGKIQVLYEVNIVAHPQRITVIVGPNGSGKSTLLKSIMGATTIYSGTIRFDGHDITAGPKHEIAKMGIAYLPQVDSVFTRLTVRENLIMAGYTVEREELEAREQEVLDMFPFLRERMDTKAHTLSGGERQMLAMAMALVRRPRVVMFDEPTAHLAPRIAEQVFDKIIELRDKLNLTILLVEQNALKALEIGDDAYLLVSGRTAYSGPASELLANPELGKMYLGLQ